jgi:hypothetical protein
MKAKGIYGQQSKERKIKERETQTKEEKEVK